MDVTSINAVYLAASFTTKMESGTTTRTGYYKIITSGGSPTFTSSSGEISRRLVSVGGTDDKGIGSLVYIFDVSSVIGSVTFTFQHKNEESGELITTGANLVAVGLTTVSGTQDLDYDVQRIETIDADSLAVDTTWHNVTETSAITNPAGGNIFIASSINSKTSGTSADGEWKLQYKQGASGTWLDMGVSMSRSFADAAAIGMTGTVSVLENQSAADFYFRLRNRLANITSDDVVTFNTNLVAFTLGTSSDGKTFPVYKVEGGPEATTSTSMVTALSKNITPSNAASLYLHAQYSMSASAASNAPAFDLYVDNSIYDGLDQYRAISGASSTGSGISVGLATGLMASTTYNMSLRHQSTSGITLTTDDISLIGIQLSHNNDITWTGTSGTDWNTSGNWNGGVPGSSDNVIIPNVINPPAVTGICTCYDLNLATGAVLTISGSGNLTVGGNLTNEGTVTVSATLDVSGSMNVQGGTLTINSPGVVTITNNLTTTGTVNVNNTLTVNGSATIESGNLTVTSPGNYTVSNNFMVGNGSSATFTLTSGTVTIGYDLRTAINCTVDMDAGTLNIGDTWCRNANEWAAYGTIQLSGGSITVEEDCKFRYEVIGIMENDVQLRIKDDLELNSDGWTITGGTITLTGENSDGNVWFDTHNSSHTADVWNLVLNKTGGNFTLDDNGGLNVKNDFTVTAGEVKTQVGSDILGALTVAGVFKLESGATFRDGLPNTYTYSVGSFSFDAASTYELYGTTQDIPIATFGNLTISTAGTKSITGSTTVAGNLNVSAGVLSIPEGKDLTVAGTTTNSAGTGGIVIESSASGTGSLIHNTSSINGTVERYIPENGWHQFAPATTSVTANNFYWSDAPKSWLVSHDESQTGDDSWTYITNTATALNVGQGYMVWLDDNTKQDATATMEGEMRVTDLSPMLQFTDASHGWNLLGNPFPSAIDYDDGSWDTNTTGFVYVWDNTKNTNGDYVVSGTDLTGNIIPVGQGFFVDATSAGSFTIPAAAREHNTQDFWKSSSNKHLERMLRIQLNGDSCGNTVFVGFPDIGTSGTDYAGDARKLYSSSTTPQLFVLENELELCINSNKPLEAGESKTVPLYLVQVLDMDYSLSVTGFENLENYDIILEDTKTGTTWDLNKNPVYNFSGLPADDQDRFLLHFTFSPDGITEPGSSHEQDIQIYSWESKVYIRSKGKVLREEGNVIISDMMGRILHEQQIGTDELVSIPINIKSQYVIVKVQKESTFKTTKVFLK